MNSHNPFNTGGDGGCTNDFRSADQLVDRIIGDAYHVVKEVYLALGNLTYIYNYLQKYGLIITVDSEDAIKDIPLSIGKFARVYNKSETAGYYFTDYLYVADDTTGIPSNDPTSTGSWVSTKATGSNASFVRIWKYRAEADGVTSIVLPTDIPIVGVQTIYVEGVRQDINEGFTYNEGTATITLADSLEAGNLVTVIIGVNDPDMDVDVFAILKNNDGASNIGTSFGITVEDALKRDAVVYAAEFGVTGDGVACGSACVSAIEYIMQNGGTLVFPKGEVNWGTTRHQFAIYNGKPCTIKGSDGGTTWTFDNVDPVANATGAIWAFSEPFLVEFGGQPTTQGVFVEPVTVENLTIDYTRQVNKGGPTYELMGIGAHPTPYSDGTLGLRFSYCRSPVVRNVRMNEIYGSGIQFWKCSMALAENNYLYNVSANQPLGSGNNESVDHFGWAIWSGASPKSIIRRNTAINKRVFVCDPALKSPNNNVVYNGTLCGYIGIFAEYGSNGGTSNIYPPDFEWQADASADKRSYITMEDNLVWGYTMSIKSEANTSSRIINNTLLNHYIGVSVQASADVVGNYINGLQADLQKCPQNGFELQRGGIQLSWWSSPIQDHRQYVAQNYVYSAAYNCISIGKAYATIDDNQFTITGSARFINSVTSFNVDLLEMRGNKFLMSETCTQTVPMRVTNCSKVILESNLIENKSPTVRMSVQMANPVIRNNTFKGWVQLYLASAGSIVEENISTDATNNKGLVIQVASASDCIIRRNQITKYNADDEDQIIFLSNAARATVDSNTINYAATTGSGRTKNIPVIKTFGTCFYTRVLNNKVIGDSSATFGFTLFDGSSGARVLECRGNSTDNATRQMFALFSQSGPWFVSGNDWTQTYNSEINTAANIYASYKPAIGEKVPYLRPQAGGAEGIVYTASGWLTFGSIASA